ARSRAGLIGGLGAAAFLGLPIPIPLPTSLPTPSLPPVTVPVVSSPPATIVQPSATALPTVAAPPTLLPRPQASAQPAPAAQPGPPKHGVVIPFTAIYVDSPFNVALLVAIAVLPLLFGIWLLLFGRTVAEARRARDAQVRLMLAADLGLRPRDLTSMSTRSLFSLREKSAFDELTGVLSRAAGISAAEREIARARRHGAALSVAFLDVDGLRAANDKDGRAGGDELLRRLVEALKEGLRPEDVLLRFGGDEFVAVLPETSAKEARATMGEVQLAAARTGIRFSAGVAELRRSDDVVSLFARADGELYDFKVNRGEIVPLPTKPGGERTVSA
ncbi:MAG TPA: GGDEF domain-containing protein, partial [Candidatus Dormibacteraeota bacterium]|nr:GGDEF domain-containing protein [Candidatus Dormibacteraeota bacterium]